MLSLRLLKEELGKMIRKGGYMDNHFNLVQSRQSACVGNTRPVSILNKWPRLLHVVSASIGY